MKTTTLGQYIRSLRDTKDLSLREFAEKLNLSPAFISDVELGRRFPSDEVLATIASMLGTTKEDLKQYDARPPVEEIKEKILAEPQFGVLLRRAIENKSFDAERLNKIIEELEDENPKP